jgi:hypothetical protein
VRDLLGVAHNLVPVFTGVEFRTTVAATVPLKVELAVSPLIGVKEAGGLCAAASSACLLSFE